MKKTKLITTVIISIVTLVGCATSDNENDLNEIADVMRAEYKDVHFFCGHCTGELAYSVLKERLGDQLTPFYTGFTIDL